MNNGHGELNGSGIRTEDGHPFDRAPRAQAQPKREIAAVVVALPNNRYAFTVSHRFPDPLPATLGRHRLDRGSKCGMN